jgi:hypothetical protein
MMDEALAALASAGGTALVTAMVTDGWEDLRGRFAQLLGRGDAKAEATVLGHLDESRTALAVAGGDPGQIAVVWKTRLENFLEHDLAAAEELRVLIAEAQAATTRAGRVEVHATAHDRAQQAVQGQGTMNVTFSGQHGTGSRP